MRTWPWLIERFRGAERWLAVILLVTLPAAGCARLGGGAPEPRTGSAILVVENRDAQEVAIYALRGSQRERLGSVSGFNSVVFELPQRLQEAAGSIQFQADPIGSSRRLTSDAVSIRPGLRLEWTLESGLRRGVLAVY